ncbi:MAG: tyrosine-type recombinase/integrase, partial [Burkholderiales bacterium]
GGARYFVYGDGDDYQGRLLGEYDADGNAILEYVHVEGELHLLRHACGYHLANAGHDTRAIQHYLGHRNITHTVRYTELNPDRFNAFWND